MQTTSKHNQKVTVISVLVCTLLLCMQVGIMAQSQEFRISPLRFAGVHTLGSSDNQSDGFMVLHTASGGDWNFQLLDSQLQEVKSGVIETPRFSFFNGLTSNGDYTLMSFVVNAFSLSVTYVILDSSGNEVARNTRTDVPMLRRGEQFFPAVYNHPREGFLIVQASGKRKRAGYTVEHVDYQMNTLWSIELGTGRGIQHVYDLVAGEQRLYILEATERFGKTLNARLQCIDLFKNEHIYTLELSDDELSYFPTALRPLNDNGIALAGTYFNGSKIRGRNTQGLFFMNIDDNGYSTALETHAWRGLRRTLRTPVPDWFFRVMPDVHIHALETDIDGSFTAVAELYRYSGEVRRDEPGGTKEQYHRIRLLDFMLFGFDSNGQILYTDRIERPHMVIKLDSGIGGGSSSLAEQAGAGPLRRAKAMKKAGAFTYRFHQKTETGFNLAFMSYENKMHYAYLMDIDNNRNSMKVDLRHAKPKVLSYLQIVDLCANQSGFGFILAELNTRSFDDSEAYWRGLLPASQSAMLTYEFMPLTGKLKLDLVQMPSASKSK